jgi:thiamine-phosphate pyrophosphorylase
MLVTDRHLSSLPLPQAVAQATAGGVGVVQLRERDLPAGQLLALALELRRAMADEALLVINDRVDVALACHAQGVHLPEAGLPVAAARRLVGERMLVGRSVHGLKEALRAQEEGADYVVVGPIYPTPSHPGVAGAGPQLVREVASALKIPVLAIGGIDEGRVTEVVRAGAAGIAVISAILGSGDMIAAARRLREALERSWAGLRA